ncbi:MAG TPA: anthranilate synthase component I family protein [Thermoplasmata archaeon]|nr:anthranilate synthase component I family protein [Thermoplasmata archaeon]
MTDPWTEFASAAETAESAGYFEQAAGPGTPTGSATWFTGKAETRPIDRRTDVAELARETERFLRGGRTRVVLGYLGFDAVGLFEPALASFPAGSPFPLGEVAFVDRAVSRLGPPAPALRPPRSTGPSPPVSDSLPRARYEASVRRLVRDIRDGEAFQVVLAHRRAWPRPQDLLERAGRLRASERYAFFFYLRFGDREVVGASPESVLEVDGAVARINPIAGTVPLGRGRARRMALEVDPKELAEHRMLVDLARNDLGAVARPGSVRLASVEQRERYARLEHLVSRVEARLRPGVGPWEALASAFPAGTVSGAPKIRATELLRREERSWRGPYAGTVGRLRPGGRAEWALTIRSAFAARERLYTAAGAGIVHRSRPGREFTETLTKLSHVERTLAGGRP